MQNPFGKSVRIIARDLKTSDIGIFSSYLSVHYCSGGYSLTQWVVLRTIGSWAEEIVVFMLDVII